MESRWLDTVECVQQLMVWHVLWVINNKPNYVMRQTALAIKYCDSGKLRIKNEGSQWWVHILRTVNSYDFNILIHRLIDCGFYRRLVVKTKYIYGAVK